MKIKVNEKFIELPASATLFDLKRQTKPDADVVIFNGAVMTADHALDEGDEVVLIRRGETPAAGDLEALMMARHTPGVHARLTKATVGIAGLGGLGSAIAIALSRMGVGHLVLVDFDVVEPSNLNRQQYLINQIGKPKTEALVENLRLINPYVRYTIYTVRLTPTNVPKIFAPVHVLVEAFDRADQKAMLLHSFGSAFPDKPIVAASGLAGHGPSGTIKVWRIGINLHMVGDLESAAEPGQGLMAPRVGVAAHIQANTVLRILMGETEV
jgi:sulfur carrier protein ThiS adenylyltransferase